MARPRSFDTSSVLSKVTELFWSEGYEAVSIQDIAKTTGLRPGSLHAAFGNKSDLFALAFEQYGARFDAHMRVDHAGLEGAREYLEKLIAAAIEDPDRKGCLIVNTASELAAHPEPIRIAVGQRLDRMKSFFRERLAEAGKDSEASAHILFGAAISILVLARADQSETVLQDIANGAMGAVAGQDPH